MKYLLRLLTSMSALPLSAILNPSDFSSTCQNNVWRLATLVMFRNIFLFCGLRYEELKCGCHVMNASGKAFRLKTHLITSFNERWQCASALFLVINISGFSCLILWTIYTFVSDVVEAVGGKLHIWISLQNTLYKSVQQRLITWPILCIWWWDTNTVGLHSICIWLLSELVSITEESDWPLEAPGEIPVDQWFWANWCSCSCLISSPRRL